MRRVRWAGDEPAWAGAEHFAAIRDHLAAHGWYVSREREGVPGLPARVGIVHCWGIASSSAWWETLCSPCRPGSAAILSPVYAAETAYAGADTALSGDAAALAAERARSRVLRLQREVACSRFHRIVVSSEEEREAFLGAFPQARRVPFARVPQSPAPMAASSALAAMYEEVLGEGRQGSDASPRVAYSAALEAALYREFVRHDDSESVIASLEGEAAWYRRVTEEGLAWQAWERAAAEAAGLRSRVAALEQELAARQSPPTDAHGEPPV